MNLADRTFQDSEGNRVNLDVLCMREPAWAANRIRALNAALADVFALIDEGFLVRQTANDYRSDWALQCIGNLRRLADASKQILPESSHKEQSNG